MWIIKEYPLNTNYIVYEDGRIYSKRFNKFLTPKTNWDGYHRLQIWKNGKCKMVGWHRIIADTFIPNPENKPFVNHIDGDKTNNSVDNLEWVTQQENIQHAIENGLYHVSQPNKGREPVDMLTLDGEYIMTFKSQEEAGEYINRHSSGVTKSCKGKIQQCGGYKWRYSENI